MSPKRTLMEKALIFKVAGQEHQQIKPIWSVSRNVLSFTIHSTSIYSVFWNGGYQTTRGRRKSEDNLCQQGVSYYLARETAGNARTPRKIQQTVNDPPANSREGKERERTASECHAEKLSWMSKASPSQILKRIAKQDKQPMTTQGKQCQHHGKEGVRTFT